jgi:TetR/AcrR family tetracycline transcriptional repressor
MSTTCPCTSEEQETCVVRKGTIDRQLLLDAALRVAGRVGFDGLTMRMVADELGVSAMAAYRHVPSRETLISMVTDQLSAGVEIPDEHDGTWDQRLRRIECEAFALRAPFPGQPDSAELTGGPQLERMVNGVMDLLIEAGFDEADAATAFEVIWAYFHGQLHMSENLLRSRAQSSAAPEVPTPPVLARLVSHLPSLSPEDLFVRGLDILLDGLRAKLAAQSAARA